MMENLPVILNKLYTLLGELEATLVEEIGQLSRAQINPVSLQVISDNKSRLLSAINFYDEQRKQEEKQHQLTFPYPRHSELATLWDRITVVVRKSAELNQKSYQLLNMHMKKMNDFKKIVSQTTATAQLYGESGNRSNDASGNVYRISV
ncbi:MULTISPECIES: flagella synthesis protein FlgN [Kosakonia]|uniref:flagella synthesis protein FlgN n=1 Tax=Kosakonia TaxID=1330547 RepID=UPI000A392B5A|nr:MULTISPECIES: flagellar export chaperone FlgN [Kosakonia]MDN2485603.1 flagellar export chaperone FlgN [Kosakonia sacchari]NUL38063.1 flagellar protein FlgN [Kosakonia sacchari]QOV63059.1 flagellar export chaperone FlgN [Kosakonia pseudosacchari]WBU50406.1 flagellar export chaperone FlgN [Kosakonia pseudosacchari]